MRRPSAANRRRSMAVLAWVGVVLAIASPAGHGQPAPPDVQVTAARLDALRLRITGNVVELRAAELLNYHRLEGGVAACMKAAGRPYRMPPYVSFYEGFTDADLGYGTGGGTVVDSITAGGRRHVRNEISFARLDRVGALEPYSSVVAPADVAAFNRCVPPGARRSYHDVDPLPGVLQLSGFAELLEPIHDDPGVAAAMRPYQACMRHRYGYHVEERTDFLFGRSLPRDDAPIDGRPASAAWTRGVAMMDAAFAADVACRLPAYLLAMKLVAAGLDAWEQRHRAELDALHAARRRQVDEAALLPR